MNKKGFTLPELLVTLTIVGILAVVAFVSFTEHTQGARDSNRISNLKALSDGFEVFRINKDLPMPENAIEVRKNGELIGWQGEVGRNVLSTIDFSQKLVDPKTMENVNYFLSKSKNYYQLMTYMEGNYFDIPFFPTGDFDKKKPILNGDKLGILTDEDNTSIHRIGEIINVGYIDIGVSTGVYVAHFNEIGNLKGIAQDLGVIAELSKNGGKPNSCLTWLLMNPELSGQEGFYRITDITNNSYDGYCSWVNTEPIPYDGGTEYDLVSAKAIDNGTFSGGTDIPTETGSIDTNNIIELPAEDIPEETLTNEDDDYGYVLEQEGDDSDYKIEIDDNDLNGDGKGELEQFTDLGEGDVVKLCGWVHEINNNGYVFNNIIDYIDGRKTYNGHMIKIFEKAKKGKKWEYLCVEHRLIGKPKDFLWRIGYKAEDKDKKFYIGGLDVLLYKKKHH